MNPFSNTKKILIITSVSAAVAAFVCIFLFRGIQQKNQSASVLDDEISTASMEEARIQSIKALIEDSSQDIEKLNSYLIAAEGLVDFIETLELLGASAGVTISINSVGPSNVSDIPLDKEFIRFKMETNGSWNNSFHFLNMIEHLPYKIHILKSDFDVARESWRGYIEFDVLKFKSNEV